MLCAYSLKQADVNCVLLEARRICGGITKNTTAKITLQHGLIYDKVIRTLGLAAAKLYLQANQSALEQYAGLCRTIDCDFQRRDSYLFATRRVSCWSAEALTAPEKRAVAGKSLSIRTTLLSGRTCGVPMGDTGLHVPRRYPIYRQILRENAKPVCGNRVQ